MAYCPPDLLDDLADLLAEVRTWTGVLDKKPNVFYVRRQPFLHFHLVEGGRRRADVKGRTSWVQLDLPGPSPRPGDARSFASCEHAMARSSSGRDV